MIFKLHDLISQRWQEWAPGERVPSRLYISQIRGADIIFLVFSGCQRNPAFVVKVSPSPDRNHFLEHQYRTVANNYTRLSAALRRTVPAAVFGGELDGRYVFIQTGLQGRGVPRGVGSCRYPGRVRSLERTLDRVLHWLLAFQQETYSGSPHLSREAVTAQLLKPLGDFREWHSPSAEECQYLEHLHRRLNSLIGRPSPNVSTHGDFYIENCLFDGDQLNVFDWSYSQSAALPLWDPFLFASTLHVTEKEGRWSKPPHVLFLDHPLRPAVVRFLRCVAVRWSIEEQLMRDYFGAFLARMATRTTDEFGENSGRNENWRNAFRVYVAQRERSWQ